MDARTRYAQSGDLQIAYQVHGEGSLDVLFVPIFVSNVEIVWEMPSMARFLKRIASFARLIVFDRRGTGMSDGTPGGSSLEEQIDDVRAVLDAAGAEQPVLVSMYEGCALSALFAASHPESVRALAMMTPLSRMVRGPGYEWAQTVEERAALIAQTIEHWGSESPDNPWAWATGDQADERGRRAIARLQRHSMTPAAAAAAQATIEKVDVRDVLPSIQCPALILARENDAFFDERHSRYVADHIPGATYVGLAGTGPVFVSMDGVDDAADEIQQFLTGVRPAAASDRVLATVLFTDIVGSTERAAELGDGPWRALLERHDRLVREQVERHRGRFVKSLGDGVLAVFDGPSRAIDGAVAIREGLRPIGLDVRAGLHTGECELLPGDDVGGLAVHIGARISALASGGEVLVSSTVRDLVVGSGQTLTDRGEHELKGVPGPWRVYAVDAGESRGPE
jgi:class 3 adenylate cyclase